MAPNMASETLPEPLPMRKKLMKNGCQASSVSSSSIPLRCFRWPNIAPRCSNIAPRCPHIALR
eukprot:10523401-Karenia_brevis.AAC.1